MRLPSYQDLSKEQDRINNLPLKKSYIVVGPPGTGKTVMALYRAKMIHESGEQLWILMYSRLLAQYTRDAAKSLGVDAQVTTFHKWLFGFYLGAFNKTYPEISKYRPDWPAILEMVNRKPCPKNSLSHLIVDEGQDLPTGFYLVERHLSAAITVFADENQRLQTDNSSVKEISTYTGVTSIHRLTRNYRNTKEIAALAAHFYSGLSSGIPDPPHRSGELPVMFHHANAKSTADSILRFEKAHPEMDIGVLVPDKKVQWRLGKELEGRSLKPAELFMGGKGYKAKKLSFGEPGIKVVCYASAKGLEFDAVFLPELQCCAVNASGPEFKMLYYVLISRARDQLFLSYSGEGRPSLLNAFPRELLEWR